MVLFGVECCWFSIRISTLLGEEYGISLSHMNDGLNFSIMYGSLWMESSWFSIRFSTSLYEDEYGIFYP